MRLKWSKGILLILTLLTAVACDKNSGSNFIDENSTPTQTVTDKSLELSFTTQSMKGEYAPNHILAVWVESTDGTYIRSLKVRAKERKQYLYTWQSASSGDVTDAISGATISTHTSHLIDWNLQSSQQKDIANGDYLIKMEMTDKNKQGTVASFPFTYQDTIISQSFDDASYFTNVSITYSQQTSK